MTAQPIAPTPRQQRLRDLYAARARIDAEIDRTRHPENEPLDLWAARVRAEAPDPLPALQAGRR